MRLNVTSEIGRLKSVLVHLPGREIDVMIPPMMNQLLFDDILYGQVAREEHRRFQQLIRFIAPDIYDIQDLLEEVLEDEECGGESSATWPGEGFRPQAGGGTPRTAAGDSRADADRRHPAESDGKGGLPTFDLLPVPNYFFMRDPQVVIGDGVVICGMATAARRRESLLSKYVFQLSRAVSRQRRWTDFMESDDEPHRRTPTIEGGDILVPSRDLLLVGVTERTNRAGVRQLATSLREANSR